MSKNHSVSSAAAVLRMHEDEVAHVKGSVAVTIDGQRYQLTGDEAGDFVWLTGRNDSPASAVVSASESQADVGALNAAETDEANQLAATNDQPKAPTERATTPATKRAAKKAATKAAPAKASESK